MHGITRREFAAQAALAGLSLMAPSYGRSSKAAGAQRQPNAKTVVVIGAGLAGLTAAFELVQAGHDVTVLEAQLRAGGRVYTLRNFSDDLYADAGATRIPDTHDWTLQYVRRFNLTLDPFEDPNLATRYLMKGRVLVPGAQGKIQWPYLLKAEEQAEGFAASLSRYVDAAADEIGDPTTPGWPSPSLLKYDDISYVDLMRERGASPGFIELWKAQRNYEGGESALWAVRNRAWLRKVGRYYKIRGGNDLLPRAFAAVLSSRIIYGAPVVRIEQDESLARVIVSARGSSRVFAAQRVVCTVPFPAFRNVEVSPPLSPGKGKAVRELPYASATKVFIQSGRNFWKENVRSGFAVTDLPIGAVWDLSFGAPGSRGILVSYTLNAAARHLASMQPENRLTYTRDQMTLIYPELREHFEGGASIVWDDDPWVQGATSFYHPGQMQSLQPHVSTTEGRIHFAGEHTSGWPGWMQGAIQSGVRAAKEVDSAPV